MAVQLTHHEGGLDGEVLPQVVADQLRAGGLVHDADEGVGHLAEVLPAAFRVVDGAGEGDPLDGGGHLGKIHHDLLVVAVALAGQVVAHMLHGAGAVLEIAVEDEIPLRGALAVGAHQEGSRVQVKGAAGVKGVHVPAQAHHDLGEAGVALGEIDFLSLGEIDRHGKFLRS